MLYTVIQSLSCVKMQKPPISYMTQLMQSAKVFILKSEPVSILIGGRLKGFVWTVKNVICHLLGSPHTFTPILPIHSVTIKSGNAKIKIEINITILSPSLRIIHTSCILGIRQWQWQTLRCRKLENFLSLPETQLSAAFDACVKCSLCEWASMMFF